MRTLAVPTMAERPVGSLRDVTPEWLTAELRRQGVLLDGAVSAISRRLLNLVSTSSLLLGLTVSYRGEAGSDDLPTRLVLKLTAPDPAMREYGSSGRHYEREVIFYRDIAARTATPLPRCWSSGYDPDTSRFHLLLDDLAIDRFQLGVKAGMDVGSLGRALDWLADFHGEWWGRRSELGDLHGLPPPWPGPSTDGADLDRLATVAGAQLEADDEQLLRRVAAAWPALAARAPAHTFRHGDFHALNFFFGTREGVSDTVVDWQFCEWGSPVADVADALGIFTHPRDRRRHEHALVRGYWERLTSRGVEGYSFDSCWEEYRLETVRNLLTPLFQLTIPTLTTSGIVLRMKHALSAFEDTAADVLDAVEAAG